MKVTGGGRREHGGGGDAVLAAPGRGAAAGEAGGAPGGPLALPLSLPRQPRPRRRARKDLAKVTPASAAGKAAPLPSPVRRCAAGGRPRPGPALRGGSGSSAGGAEACEAGRAAPEPPGR